MMKKNNFPKNSFGEKFNEIYFDSLDKIKNSDEYKNNLKKIDLYKKILENNYHVNDQHTQYAGQTGRPHTADNRNADKHNGAGDHARLHGEHIGHQGGKDGTASHILQRSDAG